MEAIRRLSDRTKEKATSTNTPLCASISSGWRLRMRGCSAAVKMCSCSMSCVGAARRSPVGLGGPVPSSAHWSMASTMSLRTVSLHHFDTPSSTNSHGPPAPATGMRCLPVSPARRQATRRVSTPMGLWRSIQARQSLMLRHLSMSFLTIRSVWVSLASPSSPTSSRSSNSESDSALVKGSTSSISRPPAPATTGPPTPTAIPSPSWCCPPPPLAAAP
mmetsp:Transcript_16154/g.46000  ORF Transcript_16154/g.46000 Transcript_16154/m.46000 type:complete len:218 (+) Transcript_16154:318-971(+)